VSVSQLEQLAALATGIMPGCRVRLEVSPKAHLGMGRHSPRLIVSGPDLETKGATFWCRVVER